jgi:hypothetical protein
MQPAKPQMDVCTSCRKLYPRVYVRLCQACAASDEKRFELIRCFLEQNAQTAVGIPEIVEWTGLSRGDVVRFYEQGRLVDIDPGGGGRPTSCSCEPGSGQRCAYCRMTMAEGLRSQLENPAARRPVGETAGTLESSAPRRAPAPGRVGGGSVQPLPAREERSQRTDQLDDDGRVQYVRRVRRSG